MRAAVALALVGCVIVPSSPPPQRGPQPPQQQQALVVASAGAPPAQDCPIDQKAITLGADRVLRCRGIPFTVTFPQGANVVQEKVGPGTSFLANFNPGIAIVGLRPATFTPLVYKDPKGGLDHSL